MHRLAGQWSRYVNMNSCNSCRGCRSAVLSVEHWSVTCSVGYIERERERENNSSILPTLSETFFFLLPCSIGFMAPNGNKAFSWGAVCCVWVEVPKGRHWRPYPFLWGSKLANIGNDASLIFAVFAYGVKTERAFLCVFVWVGWGGLITFIFICTCAHTSRYATAVSFALAHLHKKEQSRLNDLIWRYVRTWQWCWEAMLLDLPKRSLLCQDLSVTGKTHWRCGFGHEGSRKESFFGMHFTQNTQ